MLGLIYNITEGSVSCEGCTSPSDETFSNNPDCLEPYTEHLDSCKMELGNSTYDPDACYQCSCLSGEDPNCFKFCHSPEPVFENFINIREGFANQFGRRDCDTILSFPVTGGLFNSYPELAPDRPLVPTETWSESTNQQKGDTAGMGFIWDIRVGQSLILDREDYQCTQWAVVS